MRQTVPVLVILLLASLGCAAWFEGSPLPAGAHPHYTAGLPPFHDDLSPWGDWLRVEPWGWVWTPWDVEPGWRPYTDGRWVWTDLGWTWVSELPWGWAPFHYGRWTYHPYYGWLWVPGTDWAPAWVAWRQGHGWIGWAPLPPDIRWRFGIGLDLGASTSASSSWSARRSGSKSSRATAGNAVGASRAGAPKGSAPSLRLRLRREPEP